jgi:hypothetical protein
MKNAQYQNVKEQKSSIIPHLKIGLCFLRYTFTKTNFYS